MATFQRRESASFSTTNYVVLAEIKKNRSEKIAKE